MFGSSSQVKAPYDVTRVYNMLYPKPKELLANSANRRIVREGELGVYNANERKTKRRYFFLFNDVLLLTKKEGSTKFWLKVYISLRSNIRIEDVPDSPTPNKVEFRLYSPKKTIILFAHTQYDKESWIQDIRRNVEIAQGGRGMAGEVITTTTVTTTVVRSTSPTPSHSQAHSHSQSHASDSFSNPSFERRTNVPQFAAPKKDEPIKLGSDIGKINLQIGSGSSSSSSSASRGSFSAEDQANQLQQQFDIITIDPNESQTHGGKSVEFFGEDDEFSAIAGRHSSPSPASAFASASVPSFAPAANPSQPQTSVQQPPPGFMTIDLLQAFPGGTLSPSPASAAQPSFSPSPVYASPAASTSDPFSALRGAATPGAMPASTTTPMLSTNLAFNPALPTGAQTFTLPPIGTFPVIPGVPMLFNPAGAPAGQPGQPGAQMNLAAAPSGLAFNPAAFNFASNPNPNPGFNSNPQ